MEIDRYPRDIRWKLLFSRYIALPAGTLCQAENFEAFASLDSIGDTAPSRQSLFAHFTTSLLPHLPSPPEGPAIILTGGLHDRTLIASSLRTRACDLVGIGRPACVKPTLPRDIILDRTTDAEKTSLGGYRIRGGKTMRYLLGGGRTASQAESGQPSVATYAETESTPLISKESSPKQNGVPLVGAGVSTFWHEWQLCRIGRGTEPDMSMDWVWKGAVVERLWWGILGGGPWGWWLSWRGED